MSDQITKAAVLGAGSMGSGIAALLASAGIKVVLLDVDAESAQRGIDTQLKRRGFWHPDFAANVTPGSTEENLDKLADCQWVVEAIFEDLGAKHALYRAVEPHLADDALLTSNTSTLPLARLLEGVARPERFAITHFFNPPRVMRLVELVAGPDTAAETVETLRGVLEAQLGKHALDCRDTPGFIANRVGCYWLGAGVALAEEHGVSCELADAAFGRAFGIPRTGVFGLLDYIGLQLVQPIWGSLESALPDGDPLREIPLADNDFIKGLVDRGLTGRTGEGGFYRGLGEVIGADYEYGPRATADELAEQDSAATERDPRALMELDSPGGRFAAALFLDTLRYCCEVARDIADHVGLIDEGLKLGFGWKKGIFELADAIGVDWLAKQYSNNPPELLTAAVSAGGFYPDSARVLATDGTVMDYPQRPGVVTLAGLLSEPGSRTVFESEAGSVHVVAHDIGIIDFHTPLNALSVDALAVIRAAIGAVSSQRLRALVVGNDEPRAFCAGADLTTIASAAEEGDIAKLTDLLLDGSRTMRALRNLDVPVVGAVRGVALGGGLELALSCDRLVVHADTKLGFPELKVGLYPGWTGTVNLLARLQAAGVADAHQQAFDFITSAEPVPNAHYARAIQAVRDDDVILMSPDHVLARALAEADALAENYQAPDDVEVELYQGQPPLDAAWPLDGTTDNDHAIARALASHYTVGPRPAGPGDVHGFDDGERAPYSRLCDREVAFDAPLLAQPANAARARHMADTRKPLNN